MRCPTLSELPPPIEGKTGWPWTEETSPLPEQMSGELDWPKISIVTPSYNQGQFIEETIRSVLLQGYPNLEYIIIDGGSNDNSVEIIKKYEKWLTYWVSEKDQGQSNAINKGLEKCTGYIFSWLNSDDQLNFECLYHIATFFQENLDQPLVQGDAFWITQDHQIITTHSPKVEKYRDLLYYQQGFYLSQSSVFMKKSLLDTVGYINENLEYTMDLELWLRIGLKLGIDQKITLTSKFLTSTIAHEQQKTTYANDKAMAEAQKVVTKYCFLYKINIIEIISIYVSFLQSRALKLWSMYQPEYQQKNLQTLIKLSQLWRDKIPEYLFTPYYWKFVLRCIVHI